jgi:hypothetical protein
MRRGVLAGVCLVAVASAWGAGSTRSHSDNTDAGATPLIAVHGWKAYAVAGVSGRLTLRHGCLLIGDSVAFWAEGTSWDGTRRSVVLDSAGSVDVGARFSGGGGQYSRADLAGVDGLDVRSVYDCMDRTGAENAVLATPG